MNISYVITWSFIYGTFTQFYWGRFYTGISLVKQFKLWAWVWVIWASVNRTRVRTKMAITRPPVELVSVRLSGTQVWSVCGMNTIQPRSNPSIAHCRSKPGSIACSAARVFSAWCEAAYCLWDIALKCFKMCHYGPFWITWHIKKNSFLCP